MDLNPSPHLDSSSKKEILENLLPENTYSQSDEVTDVNEYVKKSLANYDEKFSNSNFKYRYRYWYVIFLTINAAVANFYIGWNIGVFDPIQKNLIKMFNWYITEEKIFLSLISSTLQFGAIFGALSSGYISTKLGRRKTYMYTGVISWIGIAFTLVLNEYSIIMGRLISGICVGIYSPLVCVYVNEYVPYEISGLCGAIYETFFCAGIFFCYLTGLNLPEENDEPDQWWRVMISIPGIINAINMLCLLLIFKEEPPKYLYVKKKNIYAAEKSLKCIYKRPEDIVQMLKDYEKFYHVENSRISMRQLFSKKYRKRLFMACVLMIGQLVSGSDVIFMFSDHIYHHIVQNKKTATIYSIFTGLSMVISGICSIFIIEKFGRRKLLLIGETLIVTILLSISILYYLEIISIFIIYLFIVLVFMVGISISPICYIYASDILPENGVSLAVVCNYLTDFILCTSYLFMEKSFLNMYGTIGLYCLCCFIVLILSLSYVKETKNLSARQIDDLFNKPYSGK
jgi:sugar porter (SP) family MFS transporter